MAFDPDAYLAEGGGVKETSFDPDAYLGIQQPKPMVERVGDVLQNTAMDLEDAISVIGRIPQALASGIPAQFQKYVTGTGMPKKSEAIESDLAFQENINKELEDRKASGQLGPIGGALREALPSLSASALPMAAAIPSGIVGTVAAGPVGGFAGAGLASGAVSYRMQGADYLYRAFKQFEENKGSPLTDEEKAEAYKELLPLAQNSALWEAGPEAVGNAVSLGVGKFVFGFGKEAATQLAKESGKAVEKELARKIAEKTAAVAGGAGVEVGTEAITALGQYGPEMAAKQYAETGTTKGAPTEYPGGIIQAAKDVAPATLATQALFMGAGGAVKLGGLAFEAKPKTPVQLATDNIDIQANKEAVNLSIDPADEVSKGLSETIKSIQGNLVSKKEIYSALEPTDPIAKTLKLEIQDDENRLILMQAELNKRAGVELSEAEKQQIELAKTITTPEAVVPTEQVAQPIEEATTQPIEIPTTVEEAVPAEQAVTPPSDVTPDEIKAIEITQEQIDTTAKEFGATPEGAKAILENKPFESRQSQRLPNGWFTELYEGEFFAIPPSIVKIRMPAQAELRKLSILERAALAGELSTEKIVNNTDATTYILEAKKQGFTAEEVNAATPKARAKWNQRFGVAGNARIVAGEVSPPSVDFAAEEAARSEKPKVNSANVLPANKLFGKTAREALQYLADQNLGASELEREGRPLNTSQIMQRAASVIAKLPLKILDADFIRSGKGGNRAYRSNEGFIRIPATYRGQTYYEDPTTLVHEVGHTLTADAVRKYVFDRAKMRATGSQYLKALDNSLSDQNTPEQIKKLISLYKKTIDELGLTNDYFGANGLASINASSSQKKAYRRKKPIINKFTGKKIGWSELYALANLDEFVAQAWSSPAFQDLLKNIKVKNEPSIFEQFVRIIRDLFGFESDTMAAAVIDASFALAELEAPATRGTVEERIAGNIDREKGKKPPKAPTKAEPIPPVSETITKPEADVRYNPLGYDIADVVEDIKQGKTSTPLKAVNQVIKESTDLRKRVAAESTRRQQPRKMGKAAILERIARERSAGNINENTAKALTDFINRINEDAIWDTAISIRAKGVSNFDFGDNLVTFFLNQDKGDLGASVGIHEFWHGLSRFLPDAEVEKINKDYTKELTDYLKKNPWFLAFVGRYSLTPEQFEAYKKFNPKEAETKLTPVKDEQGNIVKYKIKFDKDNYRYIMLDEFIAEKMTDLVLGKQQEPNTFLGKLAKVLREFMALIKARLGVNPYEKFYQAVTSTNGKLVLQRQSGVAPAMQIYDPVEYDYSTRRMMAVEDEQVKRASDIEKTADDAVKSIGGIVYDIYNRYKNQNKSFSEIAKEIGSTPAQVEALYAKAEQLIRKGLNKQNIKPLSFVPKNPIVNWTERNIKRFFTKEGGLPSNVYQAWVKRNGFISSEAQEVSYAIKDLYKGIRDIFGINRLTMIAKGLSSVPPDFVKSLNDALAGDIEVSTLPEQVQEPIARMRQHIDALSSELSTLNNLPQGLSAKITANLGTYLTRSYKIFTDKNWINKIPTEKLSAARDFLFEQGKKSDPTFTIEQADTELRNMLNDWAGEAEGLRKRGGKLGAKDISAMVSRKDIPKELRDVMGENTNVIFNYANTVSKVARFISDQKFLDKTKQEGLGKFLFESKDAPQGFNTQIAAEESRTMSPLNGLRTTPEIAKAFEEFGKGYDATANPILHALAYINAIGKANLTIGSILTQVRNFIGQPMFFLFNGHTDLSVVGKEIKSIQSSQNLNKEKAIRQLIKMASAEGLVNENAFAGELRSAFEEVGLKTFEDTPPDEFTQQFLLKRLFKKGVKGAQDLYSKTDEWGKLVGWLNETNRIQNMNPNMTRQEAMSIASERTRNTYPTYSQSSEALRLFRRQPFIGPFATFFYETFRTAYHNLRYAFEDINGPTKAHKAEGIKRLAGAMTQISLGAFAMNIISKMLVGISDKDEEDLRRMLPPWAKDASLIFLPKTKDGVYNFINFSYLNPYNSLTDPFIAMMSGFARKESPETILISTLKSFLSPFTSEQPVTAAITDAQRNRTATGSKVYNEQDDIATKTSKIMLHVFGKAFTPGTITRLNERIIPAIKGETVGTRAPAPLVEIGAELTGIRYENLDMKQAFQNKAWTFSKDANEAERIFRDVATRRRIVNQEDQVAAYKRSEDARYKVWNEMYRDYMAVRRAGATSREATRLMTDIGISQTEASAIARGRYIPYEVSNEVIRRSKLNGNKVPTTEIRQISKSMPKVLEDLK